MKYEPSPTQFKILKSRKKMVFAGGGVGSGKTDCGAVFVLGQVHDTPEGVISVIGANSYSQLRDSTIRNVYKNWKKWGVPFQPQELPRSLGPFDIRVWNGDHWCEILCRSLDHYELLSGTEIGWLWCDETWGTSKAAIDLIMARLRDPRMDNQLLMTTILDDPSSWMYSMFVENFDETLMDVFYMTTYENQKNLPPGYIQNLKSIYTSQMFKRMCLSQWVTLDSASVYYNFARPQNVTEVSEFDPYLPIYWSLDFNIAEGKPMSSCLAHLKHGKGANGKVRPQIDVFDEIIVESADTNDVIREFTNREWFRKNHGGVIVTGDATGKARDSRSKTSDYGLLRDAGFSNQKVPTRNPGIRERHNNVNRVLKSADDDVRIRVHPRCKVLIKALETVTLKKGADYLEKESYAQHVGTALGYLVCREFPIKTRGVSTAAIMGV